MQFRIASGVELAWLVDPWERTVTISRAGDSPESPLQPTAIQVPDRFAGSELIPYSI